jgi:hypothetical protein
LIRYRVPAPQALANLLCASAFAFIGLFFSSCNSGSSGSNSIPPPPVTPAFTTFDSPAGTTIHPMGINNDGVIVGSFDDANSTHGFIRSSSGTLTTYDAANNGAGGLEDTTISGINNVGTIAGSYSSADGAGGFTLSLNGQFSSFQYIPNTMPSVPGSLVITSINDAGDIAGYFVNWNHCIQGFGGPPSALRGFNAAGPFVAYCSTTMASAINANGDIVGSFQDQNTIVHGYLLNLKGGLSVTIDGGGDTRAISINSQGVVVGSTSESSFVRTPDGTLTSFNPPNTSYPGSSAVSINSSGVIAGNFCDAGSLCHGYIRNLDGTFTILDDHNAAALPSLGTTVVAINDAGQVVGTYYDAQGVQHGFVRK